jgi:sn-glycerol 3-phosphate transport system ATP-binding protein
VKTPGGNFTIGVRPEDIRILEDGEPDADGFNATVRIEAVELVGAESYIHAGLPDGKPLIFRVAGRSAHNIDETVRVGALAGNVHVFGGDGQRLND